MKKTTAIVLLIIATVFWGSNFAFTKSLTNALSPMWLIAVRFCFASLLLFLMFLLPIINGSRRLLKEIGHGTMKRILLLGFINFVAIYLITKGLTEIAISNSGFIISLSILFIPFIEFVFRKRRISSNVKIAAVVAIFGIYFMSYGFSIPGHFAKGDIITLLCAVIYSVYIILIDIIAKRKVHAACLMFYVFLITAILSSVHCLVFSPLNWSPTFAVLMNDRHVLFDMCFIVVFGSVLPYLLMGVGQKIVDTQTAAFVYILEPVFAMIIAIFFFSEAPESVRFIGAAFVFAAQLIALGVGASRFQRG